MTKELNSLEVGINNTFYTLTEVSQALKVTRRTLYTYIAEGKLKAVKFGGRWRVSEDELKAFMKGK